MRSSTAIFLALLLCGCASVSDPVVSPARLLGIPEPSYPIAARRYGEEGTVIVEIDVSPEGQVTGRRVKSTSGHRRLDAAALDIGERAKVASARTQSGKPAAGTIEFPLTYRLERATNSAPASGETSYATRIAAAIKKNLAMPTAVIGNPRCIVEISTLPSGAISSSKIIHASESPEWDAAVLMALNKTESIPLDVNGMVPPKLEIWFSPQ